MHIELMRIVVCVLLLNVMCCVLCAVGRVRYADAHCCVAHRTLGDYKLNHEEAGDLKRASRRRKQTEAQHRYLMRQREKKRAEKQGSNGGTKSGKGKKKTPKKKKASSRKNES